MKDALRDRYLTLAIRALVFGGPAVVLLSLFGFAWSNNLRYSTGEDFHLVQPVPFSHRHHVQGLKIDCRFCHSNVDTGEFASLPTAQTCMECHSQIWTDSPTLKPVREAFAKGEPIRWKRVYELPDFVFFNHHAHVQHESITCENCHGQVEEMAYSWKAKPFTMNWCIDCHEDAERYVPKLKPVEKAKLRDCNTCHR